MPELQIDDFYVPAPPPEDPWYVTAWSWLVSWFD